MTHPDPRPGRSRGTMRLRRSAGGGQPEKWEVTFAGKCHVVVGTEEDARRRLRELANDAHPER